MDNKPLIGSSKSKKLIFTVVALIVLTIIAGCEDEESKAPSKDPLKAISLFVYEMKFNALNEQRFDCAMAKVVLDNGQENIVSEKQQTIQSLLKKDFIEAREKCNFWQTTMPILDEVYSKIVKEALVPTSMYYFSIFVKNQDESYVKIKLGLFENLGICKEIEAQYRQIGEGTSRCENWHGTIDNIYD
ncbi:MAG: hypothetical protein CMC15_15865 [Flavobacteriaceae bacterium]|nr:hypothetical protein [Flavobacteriaceae bacterium]